jgi:hypothetical protein
VTFEQKTAPLDQYAFGRLVWKSYKHTVASPLVIRPQAVKALVQVTGTGTSGSAQIPVTTGIAAPSAPRWPACWRHRWTRPL